LFRLLLLCCWLLCWESWELDTDFSALSFDDLDSLVHNCRLLQILALLEIGEQLRIFKVLFLLQVRVHFLGNLSTATLRLDLTLPPHAVLPQLLRDRVWSLASSHGGLLLFKEFRDLLFEERHAPEVVDVLWVLDIGWVDSIGDGDLNWLVLRLRSSLICACLSSLLSLWL
jgi:hypothetical protein